MIAAFALSARAQDCAPLDEPGLRALVAEARDAVDRDDLVSFAERRKLLLERLPCLTVALPSDAWARFEFDEAVVAFALGEPWQPALATALSLDPVLPRGDLPQELRTWAPPEPLPGHGALADGIFRVDGRTISLVPELEGTHVVQRELSGALTTRVVKDAPFPTDWQAPPAPERRRTPVAVVGGVALAVVGAGVGAGTWAARGSVHEAAAADRLVLANVGGWGLAGVGLAVGGIGLALGGR